MTGKSDTRRQILEAALERMAHYGYGKTTMAEIARDCGMSAGNIYRFFSSKVDIAEAISRHAIDEVHQTMIKTIEGPGTAAEKLRQLLFYELRTTFARIDKKEKILQIGDVLNAERPDLVDEQLEAERGFMSDLLEQGVEEGDFAPIAHVDTAAEALQNATMKFRFPQRFSSRNLPTLERELTNLLDLLIAGLRNKTQ
ncbi:MAG: TetR/AcrR family transcriptional regulator [Pseudomonadota bacterium]